MVATAIHFKSPGIISLVLLVLTQYLYNKILLQATGWFITHGGFNGVTESLGSGVPL
jgi:hypothetical protein